MTVVGCAARSKTRFGYVFFFREPIVGTFLFSLPSLLLSLFSVTLVFLVVLSVSVLSAVVLFPLLELRDCRLVGGFCAPLTAAVLLSSLARLEGGRARAILLAPSCVWMRLLSSPSALNDRTRVVVRGRLRSLYRNRKKKGRLVAVSYTHLTLPTILLV